MCGIGGFLGDYDQDLLNRMCLALRHRGPDDTGTLWEPAVKLGLCHTRLAIIDLSPGGHQPYTDELGRASITFNGELYNYRELRQTLKGHGETFHTESDTEVLLKAYLVFGKTFLEHLNGIFAFAIYDYREECLIVARDHLGVKPLYYVETDNGFLFASEMKGLFQAHDVARDADPEAVFSHLLFLWVPGDRTIARAIRKLEPGTQIRVTRGAGIRKQHYYVPPTGIEDTTLSAKEAILAVWEQLSQAVYSQLVSDVEVGAFLSGGLDSSVLVGLACSHYGDSRLRCFTVAYSGTDAKTAGITLDLPYAKRVACDLNVDLTVAQVDANIIRRVPEMIFHLEEPMADPAALNTLVVAELARERGIKVLLSGVGGDDLFAGYRRHRAMMLEKYWQWLPKAVKAGLRRVSGRLRYRGALSRRIRRAFQYADYPADNRLIGYLYWMNPQLIEEVFSSLFLSKRDERSDSEGIMLALNRNCRRPSSRLDQALYLEQRHFLADHNLIYTDKMAMAAGVEVRVPYLDTSLVATAARIPAHLKQKGRTGKWVLRKAAEGIVSEAAVHRAKTGFGLPLRAWIKGPMRNMLQDYLAVDRLRKRGIFDATAVHRLIRQNEQGEVDAAFPLFAMMCLEIWFDVFESQPILSTSKPAMEISCRN